MDAQDLRDKGCVLTIQKAYLVTCHGEECHFYHRDSGDRMAETVLRNSERRCFSAYANSDDRFEYDSWMNFIDEFGSCVVL